MPPHLPCPARGRLRHASCCYLRQAGKPRCQESIRSTQADGGPTLAGVTVLCLGGGALVVTAGALGFVLRLLADEPGPRLRLLDLWSLSARLAARNLLTVAIPAAVPAAGMAILAARDPAVLLLGLPAFQLHALRRMAGPGLRRAAADGLLPWAGTASGPGPQGHGVTPG
jgi:hypothetical protein